jgi:hypothetical protein
MNSESNDFDQLRRLLALKRHEAPPPRYFNEFSSRVIARLTTPQSEPLTWWQRLGLDFDLRPALMCGLGVVVCGLLSFGVISAMQMAEPADSLASASMAAPTVPGMAPVAAPMETSLSIAPLIAKQSASPFNQFALGATAVGFSTFGFSN